MVVWPLAESRIALGDPADLPLKRARAPRLTSVPVAIMGGPGAGKTRLWSTLCRRDDPRTMSLATDDGYLVYPDRRAAAMRTIPGQASQPRYSGLEEIFGSTSRLDGVVFVASFGFDHLWPRSADLIASGLPTFSLHELRQRNLREELQSFRETCDHIVQKSLESGRDGAPRWLLIVANKVDLYWDTRGDALDYYANDQSSPFVAEASNLVRRLGTLSMSVHHLPVAVEARNYEVHTRWGSLSAPTQLTDVQARASLRGLVETTMELIDD